VSQWADEAPDSPQHPGLGSGDFDRRALRLDLAMLRAEVAARLHKMADGVVFLLGGRQFGLGFGRIEFTIRRGVVHDFVVARRIFLNSSEGFDPLPAVG
jgi:hypothetical protein